MKIENIVKWTRKIRNKNRENDIFTYKKLNIMPNDIFLVSYPKSGNTWLGFMIGNYLSDNKCNFDNIHSIVPDIHRNPEQCLHIKHPRFIKSHFPLSCNFFTDKYPNVIYLVRDGRDVAVSYFFYLKRMGAIDKEISFDQYLLMFNQGVIDKFSNWNLHVNFWVKHSSCNMMIVRYEDMHKNATEVLEKVLNFSKIAIKPDKVSKAVDASRFVAMQKQEKESCFLKSVAMDRSIPFVRKGEVGNWRSMFTDKLHENFLSIHQTALEKFGYL